MEDVMVPVMTQVMTWAGPALDGAVILLLALVLWRLRRDPTAAWREREDALREIFAGLRTTVAQAEGLARDLDARLADHHARLRTLMRSTADAVRPPAAEDDADEPRPARERQARTAGRAAPDPLARAHGLASAGTAIAEIARQLDVSPAEARVMVSLGAPRTTRPVDLAGQERVEFTSAADAHRERSERGRREPAEFTSAGDAHRERSERGHTERSRQQ